MAKEGDQQAVGRDTPSAARRLDFYHRHWARVFLVSALVLVPCFWQTRLEAGDLGSHVYNAWLVRLIEEARAPGLWVARQWNNVLFDLLLSRLGNVFGLQIAQRVSAALMVLIFFWGVFSFVAILNRRPPWFLTPILLMITYGWTFQEGLFNYYFSIGFAFWGLTAFCRQTIAGWLAMFVLTPLILLAHPLGLAWMLGAAVCIGIADVVPLRFQILLPLVATALLALLRVYLMRHFNATAPAHSVFFFNGFDQFLFTCRYAIPVALLGILIAAAMIQAGRNEGYRESLGRSAIALELYLIVEAAAQVLPGGVYLPQYAAPLSRLTDRLTSISMVLLCCSLGALRPHRWHLLAFGTAATVFFAFLYQDTAVLTRMEKQTECLVQAVPRDARIMATIYEPRKYRFNPGHILESACVGRCFSYGNYEAPSGQFRVRAVPGNGFVVSDSSDVARIQQGTYIVRSRDLAAYQLYQCGSVWTELCIRSLGAGETNDRLGVHRGR